MEIILVIHLPASVKALQDEEVGEIGWCWKWLLRFLNISLQVHQTLSWRYSNSCIYIGTSSKMRIIATIYSCLCHINTTLRKMINCAIVWLCYLWYALGNRLRFLPCALSSQIRVLYLYFGLDTGAVCSMEMDGTGKRRFNCNMKEVHSDPQLKITAGM